MEDVHSKNTGRGGAILPWAIAGLTVAIALVAIAMAWRRPAAAGDTTGADPALQQEIANLRQSDRISRQAVLALQETLAERDAQRALERKAA